MSPLPDSGNVSKRSLDSTQEDQAKRFRPLGISLERAREIIGRTFDSSSELQVQAFQSQLNRCLENPNWKSGSVARFHKKEGDLPLWCRGETDGLFISVIQDLLAIGNHKKIKTAESIFVPKNPETSVAFGSRVIARVQKEDIDTVLNGLKIQREIFEQIPDAATYFVPTPIVYPLLKGPKGRKLELESPRYLGDLATAINSFFLYTQTGDKIYPAPLELIQSLKNTALGLECLKNIGMSYQGTKAENILLKLEHGGLLSHISDFDRIVEKIPCHTEEERPAPYLNYGAREGVATEESDCFGLVLMIADTLILEFRNFIYDGTTTGEEQVESYRNFIQNPQEKQQLLRERQIERLRVLLPEQAHVFLVPFLDCSHAYQTKDLKDLLVYARTLELSGDNLGSAVIRRFITGLAVSNVVFPLLEKTITADQKSEEYLDEPDSEEIEFDEAIQNGIEKAHFPTFPEIIEALYRCESIAQSLEID